MDRVTDPWTERLSSYLDEELAPADRARLEAHLAGCARCARTLAELRSVVQRAARLEDEPPAADLWPAIAARLEPERAAAVRERGAPPAAGERLRGALAAPARRFAFTLPQLAAAAAVLMVLSAAGTWLALSRTPGGTAADGRGPALGSGAPAAGSAATPASAVTADYDLARYDTTIAELQAALRDRRDRLDPATVRVIEQNLHVIDLATEQARAALAADPANPYLHGHLADQLQRKVAVLRQATALASISG